MTWANRTFGAAILAGALLGTGGCKKDDDTRSPVPGAHPNRGNQPAVHVDEVELTDEDITRVGAGLRAIPASSSGRSR